PAYAGLFYLFIILTLFKHLIKWLRNVDVENFWQGGDLLSGAEYLQSGDDWNVDAVFPAQVGEFKELTVVEEHLRNNIFSTCIYFRFQEFNIAGNIRRFKMFFRIPRHANAEIRGR